MSVVQKTAIDVSIVQTVPGADLLIKSFQSKSITLDRLSRSGMTISEHPVTTPFETFGYEFKLPDTGHWP